MDDFFYSHDYTVSCRCCGYSSSVRTNPSTVGLLEGFVVCSRCTRHPFFYRLFHRFATRKAVRSQLDWD